MEHKFDMELHSENFSDYGKLCRERTNKAMIKTRQVQVVFFFSINLCSIFCAGAKSFFLLV